LLLVAFGDTLTRSTSPNFAEITSGATPLDVMKRGFESATPVRDALSAIISGEADISVFGEVIPECLDKLFPLFFGNVGGAIGETSALALIIGGIYLIVRRVIKWHTPAIYIGTVFVFSLIFKLDPYYALYQVLAGGLIMGAFFMATDFVTSPVTKLGQVLFGIGCGILTVVFRYFGLFPEGVTYAILLMNLQKGTALSVEYSWNLTASASA
jgi:Na+-translocating ferredoxin:NAD+ oxidoreductase RnfD subunit